MLNAVLRLARNLRVAGPQLTWRLPRDGWSWCTLCDPVAAVAGLPPGWQAPTTFHAAQSVAQTLHGRSPAADPTRCERRLAAARSKFTAGTEPRACAGCCEVTLTKYRRQGPEVCQVSAATRRSTGTEAMDYTMVSQC
jgi:hypothetical protein